LDEEVAMGAMARPGGEPMMEINTTPLIDVMLVLIIMLILTIPPQTHAVTLDLPQGPPPLAPDPVRNVLVVTNDGQTLWNGQRLSDAQLDATLVASVAMSPQPELHFRPDAKARYERVDDVLAMTKRAEVRRLGFVGNERYRAF
jgi:biopolymer transport protein ExbD